MADTTNIKFHLSFAIGPVQGFVAQARRTRDFWSGSWMLSHLAEVALKAAEDSGGIAIIPYRFGSSGQLNSLSEQSGGIPNRFEIAFESEAAVLSGANAATDAFNKAWHKIASLVWETFVAKAATKGNGTREIWDRQVANFWEVGWVIGQPNSADETINQLAAARKNLRDVNVTNEHGTKCSVMGNLQEISGQIRYESRMEFWDNLQSTSSNIGELDIGKTERMCAIALIKRFFPKVSKQYGCSFDSVNVNWPSTAFLAVLPWLQNLSEQTIEKAKSYARLASEEFKIGTGEQSAAQAAGIGWASIDAPAWFTSAIESSDDWGLVQKQKRVLKSELMTLYELSGNVNTPKQPLPYYAFLLMDGDSMGKLLQALKSPAKLSACLHEFTSNVDNVVKRAHGRTVYAGGDDVLAILPASAALSVAGSLHGAYERAFAKEAKTKGVATISGAIVFAHWKYPLRQALEKAHHLLNDIAKNATGRDSLAIGIIQGSGLNTVWSAPWEIVQGTNSLHSMLPKFGSNDVDSAEDDDTLENLPRFNASFLYHLREQFSRLFAYSLGQPGEFAELDGNLSSNMSDGSPGILHSLANAEFRRRMSKKQRKITLPSQTSDQLLPLIQLSQRAIRDKDGRTELHPHTFRFDGWRVARFLKQVEEGKIEGHE